MTTLIDRIRRNDNPNFGDLTQWNINASKVKENLPKHEVERIVPDLINELRKQNLLPTAIEYQFSEKWTKFVFEQNVLQSNAFKSAIPEAIESFADYLESDEYKPSDARIHVPRAVLDIQHEQDRTIVNLMGGLYQMARHHFKVDCGDKKPDVDFNEKLRPLYSKFGASIRAKEGQDFSDFVPEIWVSYFKGEELESVLGVLRESLRSQLAIKYNKGLIKEEYDAKKGVSEKIRSKERAALRERFMLNLYALACGLAIDWAYTKRDVMGFSLMDLDKSYLALLHSKAMHDREATGIAYSTKFEPPNLQITRYIQNVTEHFGS